MDLVEKVGKKQLAIGAAVAVGVAVCISLGIYFAVRENHTKVNPEMVCTEKHCPEPLDAEYMTFEQMQWYLLELNKTNSHVNLTSIGKTFEERDLWLTTIRPWQKLNADEGDDGKKPVWIEAGLHAREWISPAVAMKLIHKLTSDCGTNCDKVYYIAPMVNPDGYEFSQTEGQRLWRKNRRDNEGSECKGVDLNRNWDVKFGLGASNDSCENTYMGTAAFSEPETKALSDTMTKVKDILLVVSLHSFSQKVLYPYGFDEKPANLDDLIAVGTAYKDAIFAMNKTDYAVKSAFDHYEASGATDDWSKKVLQVPYVYTIELPPLQEDEAKFELPPSEIVRAADETFVGLQAMMDKIKTIKAA